MSFLYPAFLLGALAIAVPIVLHLLRRDVAPEVPFTAVHLLRKSPIERSRRRRLRDLLLLAARIAALFLLAAAFARPYATGAAAPGELVIVAVDRSLSMGAPGRMAKARDLALAAVDDHRTSRVAVVAFDERADVVAEPGGAGEARAALEAYRFNDFANILYQFTWHEFCDWYIEMSKPALNGAPGAEAARSRQLLLELLQQILLLLHPIMPFVTEEVWRYHPSREGHLAVHRFPQPREELSDPGAEEDVRAGIELTRRLRAWRDLVDVPAAVILNARADGPELQEFVGRLSRFSFGDASGDGVEPVASVGPVRVLSSAEIDAEAVRARLEARREELRAEVARVEGKLGNERFVAKAPAEVVEEERAKLARYRGELEELSE